MNTMMNRTAYFFWFSFICPRVAGPEVVGNLI